MGQRTSVYLDDDLHAAAKASGIPLAELVRRGLAASTAPPAQAQVPAAAPLGTLDDGEPSPASCTQAPDASSATPANTGSASSPSAQPAPQP